MAPLVRKKRRSMPSEQLRTESAHSTRRLDVFRLLGELSDAISLVTVVHRSLAGRDASGIGDDEVALRHALGLLRAAYTGLDSACCPFTTARVLVVATNRASVTEHIMNSKR